MVELLKHAWRFPVPARRPGSRLFPRSGTAGLFLCLQTFLTLSTLHAEPTNDNFWFNGKPLKQSRVWSIAPRSPAVEQDLRAQPVETETSVPAAIESEPTPEPESPVPNVLTVTFREATFPYERRRSIPTGRPLIARAILDDQPLSGGANERIKATVDEPTDTFPPDILNFPLSAIPERATVVSNSSSNVKQEQRSSWYSLSPELHAVSLFASGSLFSVILFFIPCWVLLRCWGRPNVASTPPPAANELETGATHSARASDDPMAPIGVTPPSVASEPVMLETVAVAYSKRRDQEAERKEERARAVLRALFEDNLKLRTQWQLLPPALPAMPTLTEAVISVSTDNRAE